MYDFSFFAFPKDNASICICVYNYTGVWTVRKGELGRALVCSRGDCVLETGTLRASLSLHPDQGPVRTVSVYMCVLPFWET